MHIYLICIINMYIYIYIYIYILIYINNIYSQDSKERGEAMSLTPLYQFHPFQIHFDNSQRIAAERSPLHLASSRTRTRNLWFPSASD